MGALSEPRRRHVLAIVANQGKVDVADLARKVAAREVDEDLDSVSGQDRQRTHVRLVHADLPKLDALGVVEFDRDAGEVTRTTDTNDAAPMVTQSGSVSAIDESVVEVVANERRLAVLSVLLHRSSAIDVGRLAHRVAALENDVSLAAVGDDHRERVRVSLHHAHLPKLANAEIVVYHRSEGEVTLCPDRPDAVTERLLNDWWGESFPTESPLSRQ